jgi:uncharacterized membrane protein (DUF106 family)
MEKNSLFNHSLKFGFIIGIINIIIGVLAYMVGESLMVKWWFGLLILVINIGLVVYSGNQYRSSLGGFMNFKTAFSVTFLTLFIAGILGTIFNIILYHLIDPELPSRLLKAAMEQTEQMMTNMGAPADRIDQQMVMLEDKLENQFTLIGQIKSFGIGLIVYAVLSLILGAILKKSEKIEEVR